MIFIDHALAQRLERTEGKTSREFAMARSLLFPKVGAAWLECAGAYAMFDGAGSPVTQTFGLGLFEEPTVASLETIERFFLDRGSAVVHEVSPFAGIATLDLLCARGYRPIELSSVMYQPIVPIPETTDIRNVRIARLEDAAHWADVSARGWAANFPEMLETIRQFGSLMSACEHSVCFLAEADGQTGAAGMLAVHDSVALFGGASTVPEMRRQGLQTALLEARMQYAHELGCDLAMMVTAVGSQSQRNAERAGFRIAYTRTKWQLSV